MKWAIGFIFCLLVPVVPVVASYDGGTVSPFSLGAGARDLALGGAGIAVGDVATAPFWNASRLARAEHFTLSGFHSRLYDSDVAYQYAGLVVPTLDFGVVGVGIFRLGIDGIEKRDANNLLLDEINDSRLGFNLAYGRIISGYDVGLAFTMEHHSLDNYSATSSPGLSLSVGRRFEPQSVRLRHVSVALNGRNLIQPRFKLADENISYSYNLTVGVSLGLIPNPKWDQLVTISTSLTKIDWVDPRLAVGLEYGFNDVLYLRGGLRDSRLAAGVGLTYRSISFDYALVDRDLGSLHMFSLTTAFGKPLSEKRKIRAKQREVEFNNLMSKRLAARNRQMIFGLVQSGKELLEDGDLVEASSHLDRALFLARANSVDTSDIRDLALEVQKRLDEVQHLKRFRHYLDSAQIKLEAKDYLAAKYFANLALTEEPSSIEASNLVARATTAIEELSSREDLIQQRLGTIDSLLSCGQVTPALSIAYSLEPFAANYPSIQLVLRRVTLERWKITAMAAYGREDYETAGLVLDSALAVFPGQQWCLELQSQIIGSLERPADLTVPKGLELSEPLSDQLRKEVDIAYKSAQDYFEQGDLATAIKYWEKVERLAPNYLSVREYLVNAYKFLGVKLYSQNQLQQAVMIWKKTIQLDPENSEIAGYIKRTETEIHKLKELSYDQQ